ncbi:MAG: hypothetical protein CO189_09875 [candidate division Zixibacteria bacterium CG_4_9_14_3_um_filter_46_8]|nr:MAG: hypothetical protein CO189_09875 [candidate division Zixibacteria bacterium CG_4_9_14_3_um_filter_46_8]
MQDEENKNEETSPEEKEPIEDAKSDKLKHQRLAEEQRRRSGSREQFKDFARDRMRHDARGVMRKKKDKFLGGTHGRRGG